MRILALDHGTKRIGIAVSDELKLIAQPLEFVAAEPFADFLARLKQLLAEKQVDVLTLLRTGRAVRRTDRPRPGRSEIPAPAPRRARRSPFERPFT